MRDFITLASFILTACGLLVTGSLAYAAHGTRIEVHDTRITSLEKNPDVARLERKIDDLDKKIDNYFMPDRK